MLIFATQKRKVNWCRLMRIPLDTTLTTQLCWALVHTPNPTANFYEDFNSSAIYYFLLCYIIQVCVGVVEVSLTPIVIIFSRGISVIWRAVCLLCLIIRTKELYSVLWLHHSFLNTWLLGKPVKNDL